MIFLLKSSNSFVGNLRYKVNNQLFVKLYISKKIIFLGTPECSAESLKILSDSTNKDKYNYDIIAVVTQPPSPSGRKREVKSSPVQSLAENLNIPIYLPIKANEPWFLQELNDLKPDLCITAAYGNFLPQKFLNIPKYGTVNIHPSLLPKYRGAAPIQRCLENGDKITGVSVVFTVLKMDSGPIISQTIKELHGNEKTPELLMELFTLGTKNLLIDLPKIMTNTTETIKQNDELATPAPKLTINESRIDFSSMNSYIIHNKVRAFSGWPGTWTTFTIESNDQPIQTIRVKIITTTVISNECIPTELRSNLILLKKYNKLDVLSLYCGDGTELGIVELQPESRKVMGAKAFLNGLRGNILKWSIPPVDID